MIKFALTFDDGPGPLTEALLNVLEAHGVRATFFILGRNVEKPSWYGGTRSKARSLLKRALEQGHVLGNHTYSHIYWCDEKAFAREVRRCDALIENLYRYAKIPARSPIPFRLPFGSLPMGIVKKGKTVRLGPDPRLPYLAQMKRIHVDWTGIFGDWRTDVGRKKLFDQMIKHVNLISKKGKTAVFCLHDGSSDFDKDRNRARRETTVSVVDRFLTYAKQKHWKSCVCSLEKNRIRWR